MRHTIINGRTATPAAPTARGSEPPANMYDWTYSDWRLFVRDCERARHAGTKAVPASEAQRRAMHNLFVPDVVAARFSKYEASMVIDQRLRETAAWIKEQREREARDRQPDLDFDFTDTTI